MSHPTPFPGNAESPDGLNRRDFLSYFSGVGLSGTLLPGVLWASLQEGQETTTSTLEEAEKVAGLEFTNGEREAMVCGLNQNLEAYEALRAHPIPNEVPPALIFDPVLPSRSRQVTSVALTQVYLDRLKRHGPTLECVVTLTEDRASAQARRADEEIAVGRYRGPLHGIPWGGKDLLAVRGYPTTWGAKPFEDQVIDVDATVVERLDEAGAVLVANTTLGALAMGDVWFGGRTRNPWDLEQGSSGSSAGSASATATGLVGFSIGSETLGSIVSPATRCGATGLRPTFGRVSRAGAMALSWSMDKLGPLCRSVEDCALVLDAIHGADGKDPTARTVPFNWDAGKPLSEIRIGYFKSAFGSEEGRYHAFDVKALEGIDVFITPSYGGDVLLMTNLTGHPVVVLPSGLDEEGHPTSISFIGKLWGEADALRVAQAWQDTSGHHLQYLLLFAA